MRNTANETIAKIFIILYLKGDNFRKRIKTQLAIIVAGIFSVK